MIIHFEDVDQKLYSLRRYLEEAEDKFSRMKESPDGIPDHLLMLAIARFDLAEDLIFAAFDDVKT